VDDARHTWLAADQAEQVWVSRERRSIRRAYVTSEVRLRLHQTAFRERVLEAYSSNAHSVDFVIKNLLEAAHIIPDNHPEERTTRTQWHGALLPPSHRAFDRAFLGLRPDYTIEDEAGHSDREGRSHLGARDPGIAWFPHFAPSSGATTPRPGGGSKFRYKQFQEAAEALRDIGSGTDFAIVGLKMLNGTVAITDHGWYRVPRRAQGLDEVNFWTPVCSLRVPC
jgi:hypothetical protein